MKTDGVRTATWSACVGGLMLCGGGWAVPVPLDNPFLLTSDSCGIDSCADQDPVVAGSPGGRFLVSWVRHDAHAPGSAILLARLFRSSGKAPRPEIEVNSGLPPFAHPPAVALAANGSYLVTWSNGSFNPDAALARRLTGNGVPTGDPFAIAGAVSTIGGGQETANERPAISASPDDGFVVAWINFYPPFEFFDGSPPAVVAQRFDASGTPLGNVIGVNATAGTVGNGGPAVCTDSDGGTVVAWVSARSHLLPQVPPQGAGVSARHLGADGNPAGGEILIAPPTGQQAAVAVGCGGRGSFLVVWQSDQAPGARGTTILAQEFNRAGHPIGGGPHQINATGRGNQQSPALSRGPDGTFVVVWENEMPHGGRLLARRVAGNGVPLSDEFEVVTGLDLGQHPRISHYGAAGNFIVVWSQANRLFARRYAPE